MSGGPPHHPHGRQVPTANTAWNHLQVPNFFPRQPQHAHMSNEHSILHQPTWHTPTTTDTMKTMPAIQHSNIFGLLAPECFGRNVGAPGVDLSLTTTRNGNGELPTTPISLSVRDTNKINSLPASVLDIQAVELTKCTSPGMKSISPGLKSVSPGLKSISPGLDTIKSQQKRSNVRVDSILERLNPNMDKSTSAIPAEVSSVAPNVDNVKPATTSTTANTTIERIATFIEKTAPTVEKQSVIVQAASSNSHDENSNSSGITNMPTPTNLKEDDTVSTYSNEDSLDSNKSRRKRKPSKTVRVSKDDERTEPVEPPCVKDTSAGVKEDPLSIVSKMLEENKIPERRRSSDDIEALIPAKTRRKTSSESETIDNIAAMVQECVKEKKTLPVSVNKDQPIAEEKPPISVIKSKEEMAAPTVERTPTPVVETINTLITPAQKKANTQHFVEVENKLEEMFAGIEEPSKPEEVVPPSSMDVIDGIDATKLADAAKPIEIVNDTTKIEETITVADEKDDLKMEEDVILKNDLSVVITAEDVIRDKKSKKSSAKKTKRKAKSVSRRNSDVSSTEVTPKKKKINRKTKKEIKSLKQLSPISKKIKKTNGKQISNSKVEAIKDVYAYDSGSNASSSRSKGPYIHVKGPRDSPISVSVINTPINEDDLEKKVNKSKKYHDDSEYRHKVRSKGLHCSTLSNKYDAQTKDATWICAFCKRGPHATELSGPTSNGDVVPAGDLFGPYFISTDCPEFERRLDDPYDKQFKSKKISKMLGEAPKSSSKKGKRKHGVDSVEDSSDIYLGVTDTGNKTYEVWAHEDCIVWSPGIYLVGPKIVGLEEAVWSCCNMVCKVCHHKGANIGCLKRACLNMAHLCCSRASGWYHDAQAFKAYCPEHRPH